MSYFLSLSVDVIHRFNTFLSTDAGTFFKVGIETLFFFLITYMITSEYLRNKSKHLRLLQCAFGFFAVQKLVLTGLYAYAVFGGSGFIERHTLIIPSLVSLEVLGLVILTNGFLFPHLKKQYPFVKRKVVLELIAGLVFICVMHLFWLFDRGSIHFQQSGEFLFLEVVKVVLLMVPVYFMVKDSSLFGKYRIHTILGLCVYAITPFIHVINIVFYMNRNPALEVLAHPFPLISVLLFTRIVYLKLSDKAHLREQLSETKEKYEHEKELGRMKEEFVSVISHELRTPLTSIKLYSSLLKDGKFGKLKKKQRDQMLIIEDEATRLGMMIDDVLGLAKLEQKGAALCVEKVGLYDFVERNIFRNLAKRKKLKVKNTIPKRMKVLVDEKRFRHVVTNIFSNAVKFTDKGSVRFSTKKMDKCWELVIRDTGKGIPEDAIPKLFDKFYQAEHYLTRVQGGSGLGLSIAKKVVDLHGGDIVVKSKEGKGTVFRIQIPYRL